MGKEIRYNPSPPPERTGGRKSRRAFRIICGLGLLAALLFLLKTGHAHLTVEEIRILGADNLDTDIIVRESGVKTGQSSLFLLQTKRVEVKLQNLLGIKNITVKKEYPSTVEIHIATIEPFAAVFAGGSYWVVDGNGLIINCWGSLKESIPVITGLDEKPVKTGVRLGNQEKGKLLLVIMEDLAGLPGLELAELNLENPENIVLYTVDGRKVLFGNTDESSRKLSLIFEALPHLDAAEQDQVLDVRTGDRLVVIEGNTDF